MSTWFSHLKIKAREALWNVRAKPSNEPVQPAGVAAFDPPCPRVYQACDEDDSPGAPEEESQVRGFPEEEEEVDEGRPFDWEEPDEFDEDEEEEEEE